jgi:uncharacterized protein YndB with AHSA1/START domain
VSAESKTHEMTITRLFDAPVKQIWRAWTESQAVMRWWGPTAFTCPVANMDFRVGGTSLVCMRTPDGHDMYNTWTYQQIVPMQQIEFIHHFADQHGNQIDPAAMGLPPGIPAAVRHVLTFKPASNNQTEFTVTEFGYTSPQVVELSRSGMVECLDKLAASLK